MKTNVQRFISSAFLFFSTYAAFSQGGITVGYNIGSYTYSQRNNEILMYNFNEDHPNYSQKYDFTNVYQGFNVGFFKEEAGFFGGELRFSNRTITTTAIGQDSPDDTIFKRQIRSSLNTLGIGCYFKPTEIIRIGLDWDIFTLGRQTKKTGEEESFKDAKRTAVYDNINSLTFGFTFFAEMQIRIFTIRPYFQYDVFRLASSYGGNVYHFKSNNYGISISICTQDIKL